MNCANLWYSLSNIWKKNIQENTETREKVGRWKQKLSREFLIKLPEREIWNPLIIVPHINLGFNLQSSCISVKNSGCEFFCPAADHVKHLKLDCNKKY